jgi:hypothetical protein
VGSALAGHPDGAATYNALAKLVEKHKATLSTPEWNGFNILQRVCCHHHGSFTWLTNDSSRSQPALPLTRLASFHRGLPLPQDPNSFTFLMPTKSTPSRYPKTLSSSTRDTMVIWVPNLLMSFSLVLHILRSRQPG